MRCRWFQQIEQMQVQKGKGPGVRRSKFPLLACRTRRKWKWNSWMDFYTPGLKDTLDLQLSIILFILLRGILFLSCMLSTLTFTITFEW